MSLSNNYNYIISEMACYKFIITSVVLTAIGMVIFLYENNKEKGMEDYDELSMNESYIEELILIK